MVLLVFGMDFPKRVAQFRKDKNLTQQELADKVGVKVLQVRRYEAGTSQPTLDVIKHMAIALGVTTDALIFDSEERSPDDDLRLQFEALKGFSEDEKQVAKSVLESLILKHDANRFTASS
jgi:transcriptional regulator with XRE-family HTH domain